MERVHDPMIDSLNAALDRLEATRPHEIQQTQPPPPTPPAAQEPAAAGSAAAEEPEVVIVPWDDGWKANADLPPHMCVCQPRPSPIGCVVHDDAISDTLSAALYTAAAEAGAPLGCYVPTPKLLASLRKKTTKSAPMPADKGTKDEPLSVLACDLVHQTFLSGENPVLSRADLRLCHGFMVWCLSSNVGNLVSYHIDYAEVVRHQTGITTPPLLGAVLHCSDFGDDPMVGGNFAVNMRGLDHYQEWGYKARHVSSAVAEGFDEVAQMKSESQGADGWERVDYQTRRAVIFDGDCPHMATPIQYINPDVKRVIVGINVFGHNVGPEAARFPDHAARSNRVVKMLQAFGGLSKSEGGLEKAQAILSKHADRL